MKIYIDDGRSNRFNGAKLQQFNISRAQQKIFVQNFMAQTLALALDLTAQGKDRGSPGETIYAIGQAIIAKLRELPAQDQSGDA